MVVVIHRLGVRAHVGWSALVDADDAKAVVIGEVVEVLDVEGCEREVAGQAACRDPRVVHGPGADPPLSMGLPFAPPDRDALGIRERDQSASEARLRGPQLRSTVHLVSSPMVTNEMHQA